MVYGDNGGATGFLIGEENRGMACMFTMMNQARLSVGLQGVAIAERATQQALAYARERRQGRANGASSGASPIIAHPDVKRMLLTMRALTRAARAICYATAVALDRAQRGTDDDRAQGRARARLAAHAGRQGVLHRYRHRGRLARRAGAWRHGLSSRRPAPRSIIATRASLPIYEGTNGIQAIDLVTRKLPLSGGATVKAYLGEIRRTVEAVNATNDPAFGWTGARLQDAVDPCERATDWLLGGQQNDLDPRSPARRPICGCSRSRPAARCSPRRRWRRREPAKIGADAAARIAIARFFAENLAVQAGGLERTVVEGADSVNRADAALA